MIANRGPCELPYRIPFLYYTLLEIPHLVINLTSTFSYIFLISSIIHLGNLILSKCSNNIYQLIESNIFSTSIKLAISFDLYGFFL